MEESYHLQDKHTERGKKPNVMTPSTTNKLHNDISTRESKHYHHYQEDCISKDFNTHCTILSTMDISEDTSVSSLWNKNDRSVSMDVDTSACVGGTIKDSDNLETSVELSSWLKQMEIARIDKEESMVVSSTELGSRTVTSLVHNHLEENECNTFSKESEDTVDPEDKYSQLVIYTIYKSFNTDLPSVSDLQDSHNIGKSASGLNSEEENSILPLANVALK